MAEAKETSRINWTAKGMKRVKLVTWYLFYKQAPLSRPITEEDERAAAKHCHMSLETYNRLKSEHAALWEHYQQRRERAFREGGFKPQPQHLKEHRKVEAPRRRRLKRRNKSQRFSDWLEQAYLRYCRMEDGRKKDALGDRLLGKIVGM